MNSFNSNFSDITSRGKIAFVQSCWHRDIVDALRDSFLQVHANLDSRDVELFEVPGAFEIPLRAKLLACSGAGASRQGGCSDLLVPPRWACPFMLLSAHTGAKSRTTPTTSRGRIPKDHSGRVVAFTAHTLCTRL